MFFGEKGFSVKDGELALTLAPRLAGWLFDEYGVAAFNFLSRCAVIYQNEEKKNTFGADGVSVKKMTLVYTDGKKVCVDGDTVTGAVAEDVRSGAVEKILAVLA